ncbi:MAG: RIP metalloprotease RseP [Bauldia sp.]|nr:RIP metalloprotease RseP [Bauldia sp.]
MLEYFQSTGFFLPFLLVLSVLVFVHEFGHFIVARWCGVTVKVFSVGFGPELFGFTDRRGTRWKLAAIPLGGYVRFLGDEDESIVGDGGGALTPAEREGAFASKNVYQRAAIVAAGPAANFLLAIVIYAGFVAAFGQYHISPMVSSVEPGSPAAEAGLTTGDVVTAVNGRPIEYFSQLQRIVTSSSGIPLDLTVDRGGEIIQLVATPRPVAVEDLGMVMQVPRLGVRAEGPTVHEEFTIPEALGFGVTQSWEIVYQTCRWIGGLFAGRESLSQVSGPIGIAQITGEVAKEGLPQLVLLAGFLSVSVGLFNLFPIPILDGGRLVFYVIEAVRRRPLSAKTQDFSLRFGILLILLIMVVALANDSLRVVDFFRRIGGAPG